MFYLMLDSKDNVTGWTLSPPGGKVVKLRNVDAMKLGMMAISDKYFVKLTRLPKIRPIVPNPEKKR